MFLIQGTPCFLFPVEDENNFYTRKKILLNERVWDFITNTQRIVSRAVLMPMPYFFPKWEKFTTGTDQNCIV